MVTTEKFSVASLRETGIVRKINGWLCSPFYVLLIGLLAAVSNVFALELPVYTVYVLVGLYISFFAEDYLPLMPLVIFCYIAPSVSSNPGKNEASIFYPQNGGIYLLVIAALFFASVVWRLVTDPDFGGKKFLKAPRALQSGMLILGLAYVLGGVGSGYYLPNLGKNLLFGFVQFLSVFFMYWLFSGAVRWEKARKDYFAWIGLSTGITLLIQLANIYVTGNVLVNGAIVREQIFTGWGMYNNIGAMLAFMIPCAAYLACIRKHAWIYTLCCLAFAGGVVFTCSRGSILGAVFGFGLSYILIILKAKNKRANLIAHIVTAAVIVLAVVVLRDKILSVFRQLVEKGADPSTRDTLYTEGIRQFLKYPVFGATFYPTEFIPWDFSTLENFSALFPPRWHNTLIQVAASCGTVGLVAFGYHRFQTVRIFVREMTLEKVFISVSLLALLGMSLLDCHMFNIGPVLMYSMLLAFAEKSTAGIKINLQ